MDWRTGRSGVHGAERAKLVRQWFPVDNGPTSKHRASPSVWHKRNQAETTYQNYPIPFSYPDTSANSFFLGENGRKFKLERTPFLLSASTSSWGRAAHKVKFHLKFMCFHKCRISSENRKKICIMFILDNLLSIIRIASTCQIDWSVYAISVLAFLLDVYLPFSSFIKHVYRNVQTLKYACSKMSEDPLWKLKDIQCTDQRALQVTSPNLS